MINEGIENSDFEVDETTCTDKCGWKNTDASFASYSLQKFLRNNWRLTVALPVVTSGFRLSSLSLARQSFEKTYCFLGIIGVPTTGAHY
jgi:hypothetical protein